MGAEATVNTTAYKHNNIKQRSLTKYASPLRTGSPFQLRASPAGWLFVMDTSAYSIYIYIYMMARRSIVPFPPKCVCVYVRIRIHTRTPHTHVHMRNRNWERGSANTHPLVPRRMATTIHVCYTHCARPLIHRQDGQLNATL